MNLTLNCTLGNPDGVDDEDEVKKTCRVEEHGKSESEGFKQGMLGLTCNWRGEQRSKTFHPLSDSGR